MGLLNLEHLLDRPKIKVFGNTYKINNGVNAVMRTMSNLEIMNDIQKELEEMYAPEIEMVNLFYDNVIYSLQELIDFDEDQDEEYFYNEVKKLSIEQVKMLLETVLKIAAGQEVD